MDLPGRRDAEALIHPAAETYRDALGQLDQWTREADGANPGVIPCRPGCSACCHGPFDISAADVLLLREELRALLPERRTRIEQRARALLARIAALEPGWHAPYAISAIGEARFDALTEALADIPCPFLDEAGACEAYAGRPLACRMMRLGMITPARRIIENGCPIQD